MDQSSVKWWRVVDPLNPLCGCDVKGWDSEAVFGPDDALAVTALRRLDVLVGDRPFQLVAAEGEHLGVAVLREHLEPSPVQDDRIEIGYDNPHGRCLSEVSIPGPDGDELRVARYERAIQVAYGEMEGELYATATIRGSDRDTRLSNVIAAFSDGTVDVDDLKQMICREDY